MSIHPLPIFERDSDPAFRDSLTDAERYAQLKPPTTIVVRGGLMKWVAELPYQGDAKPGCGTKLVAKTHRGTELVEMLTTVCGNSGCSKSVSRTQMLEYIENSGGKQYPFHAEGQVLRVASADDLAQWTSLQAETTALSPAIESALKASGLPMKFVAVEGLLGGGLLTIYYLSEDRVDFRDLLRTLATQFHARIELRQIGARDEARLTADYEKCGQYCCCKNFLKVLKPVSMKAAKMQKATLDPMKISGRCGRLMCCLRYEDETYESLSAKLPKVKTRVTTPDGPGTVVETKTLVQLVLVRLDSTGNEAAFGIEDITAIL
ncbi:MAG: signal peptidase [Phycisphaerales bacterium]|nr:signal peptidase [Phycisphaerales bacterium]